MWATGTTEKRALKTLAEGMALLRQHNDRAERVRGQVDAGERNERLDFAESQNETTAEPCGS